MLYVSRCRLFSPTYPREIGEHTSSGVGTPDSVCILSCSYISITADFKKKNLLNLLLKPSLLLSGHKAS